MKTLDKWDCEIILAMKQSKDPINSVKEIWGRRCALDDCFIKLEDVNSHCLDIVFQLKEVLFPRDIQFTQFILGLNPNKNDWMDSLVANRVKETDFNVILFNEIGSLLRMTVTKDLPGFNEWYKNHLTK